MRPEEKKRRRKEAEEAIKSRKEQKKLEKIKFKRKNKFDRSKILAELKKCQLTSEQIDQLHTTASMQTRGLKRFMNDDQSTSTSKRINEIERAEMCLDAASLLSRKKPKHIRNVPVASESSSEDTDAISTDSESCSDSVNHNEGSEHKTPGESENFVDAHDHVDVEEKAKDETSKETRDCSVEILSGDSTSQSVSDTVNLNIKRESAVYVQVNRSPEIQEARLQLPIINEEQNIIETIRYNDVVIVSGETGSGKTTQIPQFLYEAGYNLNGRLIGITEPRRVAAISMSERVANELSLTGDEVSYQVRFSGNVTNKTMIKFLTDGVLVRECQQDFLLSKYSVIIIDEAHERSVDSDILIGLLSRVVPLRRKQGNPLKLIIMSATLRINDFVDNKHLFKEKPPIINIEARQFPVTAHFAKQTPSDYMKAAYSKVKAINAKMPKGGILVFVTSKNEVKTLCAKLKKSNPKEIYCIPLYANLPIEEQRLVFKKPPTDKRLCVIATNVAEASITIPNIKYVVDTGKEKRKVYDLATGASEFVICWTSKSSAEQRKGRAGRIGPGHCYRLYSSAVFVNDFQDYSQPPLLTKPVEDVVLLMKSMNIDNVVNFPFPNRPSLEALMTAEKKLILLDVLDDSDLRRARFSDIEKKQYSSRLTQLGKAMAMYPVAARCSKMIVLCPSDLINCIIALVSALTVREMFHSNKLIAKECSNVLGDFGVMIRAIRKCKCDLKKSECKQQYCAKLGLRHKAMSEIARLRAHLSRKVTKNAKTDQEPDRLDKLDESQTKVLRQLLLASYCDHVARKLPDGFISEKCPDDPTKIVKKKIKGAYECMETDNLVYISNDSIMSNDRVLPEFLVYRELYQGPKKKMYMRDVCAIQAQWLPYYAHKLCNFSDKSTSDVPRYDKILDQIICTRSATYGPMNWSLGVIEVPMHLLETGIDIFKVFASNLLSGEVIPWFKNNVQQLLSPPSIMMKPWSRLQPRTTKLLNALASNGVKSKNDLIKQWTENNDFLKKEYLAWFPQSIQAKIEQDWDKSNKF